MSIVKSRIFYNKFFGRFLRFTDSQIIAILKQAEGGSPVPELCRERVPHQLRLVRQVAPNGKLRVLMTNLLDMTAFPASSFADLYRQQWRIEEAFKRLKGRLNIEHVTGLSQQAVVQDVSAKIVTDNLQALTALTPHAHAGLDIVNRINHGYAHPVLKPQWPTLLSLGKKSKRCCGTRWT